jgi:hypothetical protein
LATLDHNLHPLGLDGGGLGAEALVVGPRSLQATARQLEARRPLGDGYGAMATRQGATGSICSSTSPPS